VTNDFPDASDVTAAAGLLWEQAKTQLAGQKRCSVTPPLRISMRGLSR
jgi:hypothetical protein